jgi:hypothetical protein
MNAKSRLWVSCCVLSFLPAGGECNLADAELYNRHGEWTAFVGEGGRAFDDRLFAGECDNAGNYRTDS